MQATTTSRMEPGRDLYECLDQQQREYLTFEWQFARHTQTTLAFLRDTRYPLSSDVAGAVAALSRHYVLPWAALRSRYLTRWVCDGFTARGAGQALSSDVALGRWGCGGIPRAGRPA